VRSDGVFENSASQESWVLCPEFWENLCGIYKEERANKPESEIESWVELGNSIWILLFLPLLLICLRLLLAAFENFASVARRSRRSANVRNFLVGPNDKISATWTFPRCCHTNKKKSRKEKKIRKYYDTHTEKRQTNIENSKEKRLGKWGTSKGVCVFVSSPCPCAY